MRMIFLFFAKLVIASTLCAPVVADTCAPTGLRIIAPSLAFDDEKAFSERFAAAARKVCAWWGPAWTGGFTVNVEDNRGPSMALVPAWRGDRGSMIFRSGVVRGQRSALVHEILHVYAPNANRFLAEGLAVYGQEKLGGQSAYPNFGRDLHRAAARYAAVADISALERFETPRRLRTETLDERDTYVIAGSFVRYLIETHGLPKFRTLYALTPLEPGGRDAGDPARWERTFGQPLSDLADGWKRALDN